MIDDGIENRFIPIRQTKGALPDWRYFVRRTKCDRIVIALVVVGLFSFIHYFQYNSWHFNTAGEFIEKAKNNDLTARTDSGLWSDSKATESAVAAHWLDIRESMKSSATDATEVDGVYATAGQEFSAQMWPKLAWRGWVAGQPVWVIKAVWPKNANELEDKSSATAEWGYKAVVISAESPYSVIGSAADATAPDWSRVIGIP